MGEPPRPRPRPGPGPRRRRRQGHGTGATTPRRVASDSDASSTVVVARRGARGPQQPAQHQRAPPAAATQVILPEGPSQTEINARNQVELHATTLKYIAMKKDSRPANIHDAYGPRQKEWREWCLRKRFADGELVTEGKLVAFLDQEVVGRVVRTQPRKDAPPEERARAVELATFSLYSAAIIDL
jgi:hypothetical protein